ncbi:MAG TPA: hypothetical protein VIJ94_01005 [Caulobacteraceae bacterium]
MDVGIVAEVRGGAGAGVPVLPSSDEGAEAAFFLAAYFYAQAWLVEKGGPVAGSSPCVFVLSRSIRQEIDRLSAEPIDYFKALPAHDVRGNVYIATEDFNVVAKAAHPICGSPAAIGTALRTMELASSLHAVFQPDRGELILCRLGLGGPTSLVTIEFGPVDRMQPIDLERMVWRFHQEFTQTPSGTLMPWLLAGKNVPIQKLELRISSMLCYFLNSKLSGMYVSTEHYTPHGRLDIKVAANVMVPEVGHCALELKVLRSCLPSGASSTSYTTVTLQAMVDHATDGVLQAVNYRADIGAGMAYLYCFDARIDDADQAEVIALAAAQDVQVRRLFMYNSPKAHRKAMLIAQKAGTLLSGQVD